jgi:hypothetical protein
MEMLTVDLELLAHSHASQNATAMDQLSAALNPKIEGISQPVVTKLSARVVGTPKWCSASLAKNSRIDERSTARPSPAREYGVRPAPLS